MRPTLLRGRFAAVRGGHGAPGDRERATELLTATVDLARELGMAPAPERASALVP